MGCQNAINVAELNNILTEPDATISIQKEVSTYELLMCLNVMRVKAKLLFGFMTALYRRDADTHARWKKFPRVEFRQSCLSSQ